MSISELPRRMIVLPLGSCSLLPLTERAGRPLLPPVPVVPAPPVVPAAPLVPAAPVVPALPVVPAAPVVPAPPVVPAVPVVPPRPALPPAPVVPPPPVPPPDPAAPVSAGSSPEHPPSDITNESRARTRVVCFTSDLIKCNSVTVLDVRRPRLREALGECLQIWP